MGTSSANPFALSRYSADGVGLVAALKADADGITASLSALRASASPFVSHVGDPDAVLADLVGDWLHLDEFAGDVANAFFAANPELGERGRDGIVLRMSDEGVLSSGHVGYADRDTAIAAAHQLAADVEAAMARGHVSAEDMRAFAARAARGQFDPAFSVAFVTDMGVDRMAALPALVGSAMGDADGPGWAQRLLAPFAGVLTTAMDTRAANPASDLIDPDNRNLAAGDRLSEDWVDEFTVFREDGPFVVPSDNDFSLLVRFSQLPADVLSTWPTSSSTTCSRST